MIRYRSEATIARSAHEIWAYAADIFEHPNWMAITNPRILSGSSTQAGSRGREVLSFGPLRFDVEFEVSAADPGRRIAWRPVAGAPFDGELTLELNQVTDSETRASYFGWFQVKGLWRLLGPLLALEAGRGPAGELRRLKQVMESQNSEASA
jgi:uncharacterized membrane protein